MPTARRNQPARRPGQHRSEYEQTPPPPPAPATVSPAPAVDTQSATEPVTDAVIADTGEQGGFVSAQPGTGELQSEIVTAQPVPVQEAVDPRHASEPRDNGEGLPRGYIVNEGEKATSIPVRRVQGNDDMVEAREPVWVARQAAGSTRIIHTLLMPAGTVFHKSQLDTVVP
jgi:hypothetical protein